MNYRLNKQIPDTDCPLVSSAIDAAFDCVMLWKVVANAGGGHLYSTPPPLLQPATSQHMHVASQVPRTARYTDSLCHLLTVICLRFVCSNS